MTFWIKLMEILRYWKSNIAEMSTSFRNFQSRAKYYSNELTNTIKFIIKTVLILTVIYFILLFIASKIFHDTNEEYLFVRLLIRIFVACPSLLILINMAEDGTLKSCGRKILFIIGFIDDPGHPVYPMPIQASHKQKVSISIKKLFISFLNSLKSKIKILWPILKDIFEIMFWIAFILEIIFFIIVTVLSSFFAFDDDIYTLSGIMMLIFFFTPIPLLIIKSAFKSYLNSVVAFFFRDK